MKGKLAAMALGLLVVRASSFLYHHRMSRFHEDDSPGDRAAQDYERATTVERLTELYGDKRRAQEVHWRIEQLTAAGFDELRASTIAATDADWRHAIELVRSGCPFSTAADIVL